MPARGRRAAARKRRAQAKPYQSAARPAIRRVRTNRKAERFVADPARTWLVVRAADGRFSECAAALRSAGCPVFEARQEVRRTVRGRSLTTRVPMLRQLMFAGVDRPEQACLLAGLDHVGAILSRGDGAWLWADELAVQGAEPIVVPAARLQRFADHVTGHLKADRPVSDLVEALFEVGQIVRVVDGPFASFIAVIEEVDAGEGRYRAAVGIFGRATSVELDEDQMEAA